jgi:hypothetical protein
VCVCVLGLYCVLVLVICVALLLFTVYFLVSTGFLYSFFYVNFVLLVLSVLPPSDKPIAVSNNNNNNNNNPEIIPRQKYDINTILFLGFRTYDHRVKKSTKQISTFTFLPNSQ